MDAFLVLVNPTSGSGVTAQRMALLEQVFREAGRAFEFIPLSAPHALEETARRAAERAAREGCVLVAVGGDGTLTAVAQAAHRGGCVMGAIPQGTFNYFGRAQGISQDVAQAARALLRATPQPVQVGTINGRLFLVNASLGLYPQLLDDRESFLERFGRHRWVAVLAALASLIRWRHQLEVQIEADGVARTLRTPTLFVGNNAVQLARLGLTPDLVQRLACGRMVALVLKPIGTWAMLALLLRGAFGRLGDADQLDSFAFQRLTVRLRGLRRIRVAADGETGRMSPPICFEVSPRPLMFMVPGAADRVEVA